MQVLVVGAGVVGLAIARAAALKGHEDDPVLWNDLALVLWKRGLVKDAEKQRSRFAPPAQ